MNGGPLSAARAILYGTLAVGTLDLLDAFIFFYLRSGARPMAILHGIASGLLGPAAARSGCMSTAALGFFLHFLIACIEVPRCRLGAARCRVIEHVDQPITRRRSAASGRTRAA